MENQKLYSRNFALTTLATFTLFTSFYFLLVTLPAYTKYELKGSDYQVGLIIGVFTISAVLFRPYLGREVDRRGRKNVLVAGLILFFLCMLLYNYTTSVASLLFLRLIHGIGWGAATTAAVTLIADIAPFSRRGEAMGTYGMAANVAMAIAPVLSWMLLESYDYKTLFITGAVIALLSLILIQPVSEKVVVHQKTPLFSREAFFPSVLMFMVTVTYGSIVSFLPLFTQKQGITVNPGIFFTGFAVSVIAVRVLAGRLSDIRGRAQVIVPGMLSIVLGLWVLAAADSLFVLMTSAVLYGLGFGSVHPTLMALLVDNVSADRRGAAMGTFSAAFDLGIGTGSILLGLVLQLYGFDIMYILGGLIVLAGMVLFIGMRKYIYIQKNHYNILNEGTG